MDKINLPQMESDKYDLGPLPRIQLPNVEIVYDVIFMDDTDQVSCRHKVVASSVNSAVRTFWRDFDNLMYDKPIKSIVIRDVRRL